MSGLHIVQVNIDDSSNKTITGIYEFNHALGGHLLLPSGSTLPVTGTYPGEVFFSDSDNTVYVRNLTDTMWIAVSSSVAISSSYAQTASLAYFAFTSSLAYNAFSSSFATSASYADLALSASFATTSSFSIFAATALSSSFASFATSASFASAALTASFAHKSSGSISQLKFAEITQDVSTTSTTLLNLLAITGSITSSKSDIEVNFTSGNSIVGGANCGIIFRLLIDDVVKRGTVAGGGTGVQNSPGQSCALSFVTSSLAPGNHTFAIQWAVSTGGRTGRIRAASNASEHASLLVKEIARD